MQSQPLQATLTSESHFYLLPKRQRLGPRYKLMTRKAACGRPSLETGSCGQNESPKASVSPVTVRSFTYCEKQHRYGEDDSHDDSQPHSQDKDVISALVLVKEI